MSFFKPESPEDGSAWQNVAVCIAGWLCLIAVLLWIVHRIWPALFIPWWFNTDEVVFFTEVIRQLRLDPSQTFFDIPGTPFMTLTSVLTDQWWVAERVIGLTATANPSDFAFANVQGVFTLMRTLTMAMYLGAVAIAFHLFRRCAGALVAIVAALLFATLPIHVQYSYFVRTESLGLVLSLSAIWIVLYSPWRGTPGSYCCGGVLAGIAMAARFHFAMVGLPVIFIIFLLRDRGKLRPEDSRAEHPGLYPKVAGLAALLVIGALVTISFKLNLIDADGLTNSLMLTSSGGPTQYPGAKEIVAKLWLLLGLSGAAVLLFVKLPQYRRWVWPVINPFTLLLGLGFAAGFLVSHPEFLWRGEQQLRSIQFYSDWTDPKLQSLGPLQSWWNVTTFYFTTALPERWLRLTFFGGMVLILWRRRIADLAFLAGAALCFLAHPVSMKLWPHHVIPWLPFLCFVAAAPADLFAIWLVGRNPRPARAAAVVVFSAAALIWACAARLQQADGYLITSRSRTDQIAEMNRWLSKNAPPDSYLLVSYFALNEDGFLKYIENAGVTVPNFVRKHRDTHIWWLERSAVNGHAGLVCMSRADISFFRDDFERRNPGSTYNPFENSAFQPIAKFGGGFYELEVFKFDFRPSTTDGASVEPKK